MDYLFGKDALATGLAVDHDDTPDCADLVRRGVKAYRFPLRWDRAIASTTFYHDKPAVDRDDDCGDGDGLVARAPGPRALPLHCDALDDADVAFWSYGDPRWHLIDTAAWEGLPMTRVLIDAAGMRHYADLMERLHAHGIQPIPILNASDMPDALCRVVDGWRSPLAVEAYAQFVRAVLGHMGYLARTWVSVLPAHDDGAGDAVDLDRRRSMRHMLLAQARAAGIYHRGLSGAGGAARGRFAVAISCHSPTAAGAASDACTRFERTIGAFGHFSSVAPDRDDGFAWGFTTAQRALLSRTVDAVVLDCALEDKQQRHHRRQRVASAEHNDTRDECAPDHSVDDVAKSAILATGSDYPVTRTHAQALAFWIDQAAATLPGVPIVVCDGVALDAFDESAPVDMDMEGDDADHISSDPLFTDDKLDTNICPSTTALDYGDDKEPDRDVALDVHATVESLATRFVVAHQASLMGRPVEMYLVRPG